MQAIIKVERNSTVAELMKKSSDIDIRYVGDHIFGILPEKNGRHIIPYLFSEEEIQMDLSERRTSNFVTVIADTYGNPIEPYWVREGKSCRGDNVVESRFLVPDVALTAVLDKRGILDLSTVRFERGFDPDEKVDYVVPKIRMELKVVLKRNDGKFLFPTKELSSPNLKKYINMAEAAIIKANKPKSGAVYFLEKAGAVAFHEIGGETVVMTARTASKIAFSGSSAMQASAGMTVRDT